MKEQLKKDRLAQIHSVRPNSRSIVELGSGDFNDVFLVDNEVVFRFPNSEEGKKSLGYESEILSRLAQEPPLEIPKPLEIQDDFLYGIYSYVAGNVLKSSDIDQLSDEQKRLLGHSLAGFVRKVNTALPFEEAARLRAKYNPEFENEANYHAHMVRLGEEANSPFLPKYLHYLEQLRERFGGKFPNENIVAHGDLHSGNLIFNDNKLTGIIDFSDFGPSNIYGELRQMYRMGDVVIQTIISDLGDEFGLVDLNIVRLWAITHEFSILMRPGALTGENTRAYIARKLLHEWMGPNWSEL